MQKRTSLLFLVAIFIAPAALAQSGEAMKMDQDMKMPADGKAMKIGQDKKMAADGQTMKMGQDKKMPMAGQAMMKMGEGEEVAHPFFTHMGLPEGVGTHSLRLSGLVNNDQGRTGSDFAFHYETGLTDTIGLHIRNNGFTTTPHTEAMFQFAAIKSKNGMNGFAPIIEFEFPTHSGAQGINTLVGFSTMFSSTRSAFDQVLHYSPKEDMWEGSAAFVWKASPKLYPVVEVLGEAGKGVSPMMNVLSGLKLRVKPNLLAGLGYQAPVTSRKDFASQWVFQLEMHL